MLSWLGTPGAGPFISKMSKLKPETMFDGEQFAAELLPGVMKRFAGKIEGLEKPASADRKTAS
jgi:hypothetical protein